MNGGITYIQVVIGKALNDEVLLSGRLIVIV